MKNAVLTAVLLATAIQCSALAGNWAHWRGPTGNGVATDAQPPVNWSSTENVKWKVPIAGRSSGSPVIWEQRVFVVSAVPVDGTTAQPAQQPGPQGRTRGRRSRGSAPARLSKLAFKLFCFERGTGELIWEKTATEATPHQGKHGTNSFASASPCTDGKQAEKTVCTPPDSGKSSPRHRQGEAISLPGFLPGPVSVPTHPRSGRQRACCARRPSLWMPGP